MRTVMNPVVVCGYAWQDGRAGLQLMTDHQIRRLPIDELFTLNLSNPL